MNCINYNATTQKIQLELTQNVQNLSGHTVKQSLIIEQQSAITVT